MTASPYWRIFLKYLAVAVALLAIFGFLEKVIYGFLVIIGVATLKLTFELFGVERRRLQYVAVVLTTFILTTLLFGCVYFLLPTSCFSAPFNRSPTGILDAIYFSFVTMTTLGYGDILPACPASKLVVIFQLIVGIVIVAVGINYVLGRSRKPTS